MSRLRRALDVPGLITTWSNGAIASTSSDCRPEPLLDNHRGYYVAPTIFPGTNKMRVFQEEIFDPVVSVTGFEDDDDAISIANDTLYGWAPGSSRWTSTSATARVGTLQAGRVWTNPYTPNRRTRPAAATSRPASPGNHQMMWSTTSRPRTCWCPTMRAGRASSDGWAGRGDREGGGDDPPLTDQHGPLMFHQSGGGCDALAYVLCRGRLPHRRLRCAAWTPGRRSRWDMWMRAEQFELWKHTHLIVDLVPGRGAGFCVSRSAGPVRSPGPSVAGRCR